MGKKLFKVVGITVNGDTTKVRFTDDMVRRIKQFTKGGATRADFIDLPKEMTKIDALKFMQAHASYQSPSDQATISDALADRVKEASKGTVKVKVKAKAKVKPTLESIKAKAKSKTEVKTEVKTDKVAA
jgi:hypothetical protein